MKDAIWQYLVLGVTVLFVCVAIDNRSLTKRIQRLEDRSTRTVELIGDHLSYQHGIKSALIHSGLTEQQATNLQAAAKEVIRIKPWEESKIERIKRDYEQEIRSAKNSIALGYTACRMGINLSNYLAEYEARMAKNLSNRIHVAKEDKP